jgi:hypothetical protein
MVDIFFSTSSSLLRPYMKAKTSNTARKANATNPATAALLLPYRKTKTSNTARRAKAINPAISKRLAMRPTVSHDFHPGNVITIPTFGTVG